jgi:glycosyltransferase involved in cell wall biosynthesis
MRVLLWSSTFWPHIGGVEVLGANLVRALVDRGHDVTVLARRDTDDLPATSHLAGAEVIRLRFRQAIEANDPGAVLDLRSEVKALKREVRPDVVHLYHLGPDLLFHRLTRGEPTLVTLHQAFTGELLADDVALGPTLREADAIAACSQSVLHDLLGRIPEVAARTQLVRNALPPSPAHSDPVAEGPPVVLFVGRVVPQKGFDLGLAAFAELHRRHPEARLVVGGDGVSHAALAEQVQARGLADAVDLVGWVDRAGIRRLMAAATMVVMPSRFEPFGLVALEAGQARRPVVAFAVDGLVEAVDDGRTGLLVPPGDVAALAAAMARLVEEPGLARRLGEAGYESDRSGKAWDAHVDAHEALYEKLVAAR